MNENIKEFIMYIVCVLLICNGKTSCIRHVNM